MSSSQSGKAKGLDDALNEGLLPKLLTGDDASDFLGQVKVVADIKSEPLASIGDLPTEDFVWPEDFQELPGENPLPEFSEDDIPLEIRGYVVQNAANLQVPFSFILAPLIAAFGSLIGSAIRMQPKVHDLWNVCLNMWYLLIGPPSVRKSPADKVGGAGLAHVSLLEELDFQERKTKWQSTAAALQAEREGLLEKIKSISRGKKGASGSLEDIQEELRLVDSKLAEAPRAHVLVTNDATVEKLFELEAYNRNGITLKRDEIAGWIAKLEGADAKGDRQIYIEGFEGGNTKRMDRVTREAPLVRSHTISIGGTSQPGPIKQLVKSSSGLSKQNDGFIQRFSLAVVCPFPKATKYFDQLVDPTALVDLKSASEIAHKWAKDILQREDNDYIVAKFSGDAQKEFARIYEELHETMIEFSDWPDLQAHIGKFPKLIPSLSLIFTLIESAYAKREDPPLLVPLDQLLLAERWSKKLLEHAKWIYGAREGMLSPGALALAEKIKGGKVTDRMGLRNIYRHGWSHLKSEEALNIAIEELAEYGWCAVEVEQGSRGAPSFILRLHPKLRN